MILIIGGAYQGKLDYAKEHYENDEIINDFHLRVLNLLNSGIDPVCYIKDNINILKDKVIISDDISCGVVPIEKDMRKWREALGRSLALLSKNADEVIRVFCGIGTKIK